MGAEQLAAELGLEGKDGYFEYIIDSVSNGQKQQARELYEGLTITEAQEFFDWVETVYYYEAQSDRERDLGMENLRLSLSR
jgi:hypothetical protein